MGAAAWVVAANRARVAVVAIAAATMDLRVGMFIMYGFGKLLSWIPPEALYRSASTLCGDKLWARYLCR